MGVPTFEDLKKVFSTNLIKNSKVTCKDVDVAQIIYGNDIITKKGNITKKNSSKLVHDRIYIPPSLIELNKDIHLNIGTISNNGVLFFSPISHDLFYRSAYFVTNKRPKYYQNCVSTLI